MTRESLIEDARHEAGRYKTDTPQFVAWTRIEVLVTEEEPIPAVALEFLREIGEVLGEEVAERVRPFVRLPRAGAAGSDGQA